MLIEAVIIIAYISAIPILDVDPEKMYIYILTKLMYNSFC